MALVAALCVPGLLALAAASDPAGGAPGLGPVNSQGAAAGFNDLEYSVPFYGRLFTDESTERPDWPEATATFGSTHFAKVSTYDRSGSLDLSLAVEGQPDSSDYEFCQSAAACGDVNVRVTSGGLLYLHVPRNIRNLFSYLGDFPRQRVELSASDADSGLKVYREVLVGPSPAAAGCEDYGDNTPEAYTCLFLRELKPPPPDSSVGTNSLPDELVQDASNYSLVFAEEFDGVSAADECVDGLSTLDGGVWDYYDACDVVDSRGEPCGNVVDGALVMGDSGLCTSALIPPSDSFQLGSYGKFHFKYGYVELKYTVNVDRWPNVYSNHNIVLWTRGKRLPFLRDRFGVAVRDWEDYLKNTETEIDILEYDANSRVEVAHQYGGNWGRQVSGLTPTRSNKYIYYCSANAISLISRSSCRGDETFTVTRGIEWTPRGYRTFVKVDGVHDDLIVVPKDKIEVQTNYPYRKTLTGTARDEYFEYLDPEDTDTLLEQVAIAHTPLPIALGVWGYLGTNHPYIRTRMKIDYIRVWQPDNLYTDMEPAYQ